MSGKRFGQNRDLKRHIKTVHENLKPHKCISCEKRFGQKTTLEKYVAAVHNNIKAQKC